MTRQTGQSSTEDTNTASVDSISGGRRKLIKASVAAVPVVMTLQSGAAVAAASAFQCIGANGAAPAPFLPIPRNADGSINVTANFGDKWCRALVRNPSSGDMELALIFFDANGNQLGDARDPSSGGVPATQSCAVSFSWNHI